MADGFNDFKLKVGSDVADDVRRCEIMRETIGWERKLMVDANQKWGVEQVRRGRGREMLLILSSDRRLTG